MGWLRLPIAFVLSVALMAALGTAAQTGFVLWALKAAGAPVGPGDVIAMTAADLGGFAPVYGLVAAIGFVIAFPAAALAGRLSGLPRLPVFAAAGAAALAVIMLLLSEVMFGIPVIAGTRTALGVAAQIVCGALAGAAFALLTRGRAPKP